MSDALRAMATRAPGTFVPHWTDRPTVAPEFLRVWNSFCGFVPWAPAVGVASEARSWVEAHFADEDAAGRAVLVDVFLELLWLRRELMRPQEAAE